MTPKKAAAPAAASPTQPDAPVDTDSAEAGGSSSQAKAQPDATPSETTTSKDSKKGLTKVSAPGWPQQPGVPPQ